ncbi:hypothetical protein LSM04_003380 [Trypanosoma melophagium]|uniref:uncharacterized protein n=1 Tax=Trypanosoma melophagium TaxID=715481 RepID=UPI00351A4E4D|nr:hypothetical protein LSM04_003380 [Trypanosoma melophagium]
MRPAGVSSPSPIPLPGLLLPLLLFLLTGGAAGSREGAPVMSMPAPLPIRLEDALAQSFTTSVVSHRYGVFSSTIDLHASPNFPERLHGELIPSGHQIRKGAEQIALKHFIHPRSAPLPPSSAASLAALLAEAKTRSQSNADASYNITGETGAHPSLFALDLRLDFAGSTAGTVALTKLPSTDNRHSFENVNNNNNGDDEKEEDEDKPPIARASFAFRLDSRVMASSTLSDIPPMARVATGAVVTNDGTKGTFTFRLFSEHEFSLTVQLREEGKGVVDHIWVYGYTAPNEAIIERKGGDQQPWWHMWALIAMGILVFGMQLLTAYVDAKRENNLRMQQRIIDAQVKGKKIK